MTTQPLTQHWIWPDAPQLRALWRAEGSPAGTVSRMESTINRAFLAARLLTGSLTQAETAVLEGVDAWDPDEETQDELFQLVVRAALRAPVESEPDESDISPALRRVLRLAPGLRKAFVLRLLVGLSRKACAALLGLSSTQLDDYTCAAAKHLAFLSRESAAAVACFG